MRILTLTILVFTAALFSGCAGNNCIQGNCVNGHGVYEDKSARYPTTYEGEFKNSKLWNGTITKELATGESFINVVQDGKEIAKVQ